MFDKFKVSLPNKSTEILINDFLFFNLSNCFCALLMSVVHPEYLSPNFDFSLSKNQPSQLSHLLIILPEKILFFDLLEGKRSSFSVISMDSKSEFGISIDELNRLRILAHCSQCFQIV